MRKFFFLVLILAITSVAFQLTLAQEKKYYVSKYHVEIWVRTNGSLRIEETIRFRFQQGTFTYAYRTIPIEGFDKLNFIGVYENSEPIKYSLRKSWREVDITWYYPETKSPAEREFTIVYEVTNAIGLASKFQNSLDWDAIGAGWSVQIKDIKVRVHLPGRFESSKMLSISPSDEAFVVEKDNETLITFSHPMLKPYQAYRVIVYFPRIYTPHYSISRIARDSPVASGTFSFLAVTSIIVIIWYYKGRDPKVEEFQVPLFLHNWDLKPMEVSYLVNGQLDVNSFLATIVDLAQRGYLKIIHEKNKQFFFVTKNRVIFKLTEKGERALREWKEKKWIGGKGKEELKPFEIRFLRFLKKVKRSDKMKWYFFWMQMKLKKEVEDGLMERGYFVKRPTQIGRICRTIAVLWVTLFILLILFVRPMRTDLIGITVGLTSVGFVIYAAGDFMWKRTEEGARMAERWRKVSSELRNRSEGILERLKDPEFWDQWLPYIVLFLSPNELGRLSEELGLTGFRYWPSWYVVSGDLVTPAYPLAADFSHFLNALSTTMGTISSSIATASGGGSGSGGGGGGGGGGAG